MVDGGHFEDALSGEFERGGLRDDGNGFEEEDAADDETEEFVFGEDGEHAECAAQGKAAQIAHEDLGGVGIEPDVELEYEFTGPEGASYEMKYDNQLQKAIELMKEILNLPFFGWKVGEVLV